MCGAVTEPLNLIFFPMWPHRTNLLPLPFVIVCLFSYFIEGRWFISIAKSQVLTLTTPVIGKSCKGLELEWIIWGEVWEDAWASMGGRELEGVVAEYSVEQSYPRQKGQGQVVNT